MEKGLIIAMSVLTVLMMVVVMFTLLTVEFRYAAGSEDYFLPVGTPGELLADAAALLIIVVIILDFYFGNSGDTLRVKRCIRWFAFLFTGRDDKGKGAEVKMKKLYGLSDRFG